MQLLRTLLTAALACAAAGAKGGLRETEPGTATAMAGLEGEACGTEEYARYKTIVCSVEDACKCADTVCALEWCADYVHTWKKEFGACLLKGCEDAPAKVKADDGLLVADNSIQGGPEVTL